MVIACWTAGDSLLGTLAPLGLAAAAPTALMVDLDPAGPAYPSAGSLAALAADGPRRSDLVPNRRGMAVLRNGAIGLADALPVVEALAAGWPALVLRLGGSEQPPPEVGPGWPVLPVVPLLPMTFRPHTSGPHVGQSTGLSNEVSADAVFVLPPPGRRTVGALMQGKRPRPSRWIRRWRAAWVESW